MTRPVQRLPRIVLGDHGFLPQYGSLLRQDQIVSRMCQALQLGLSALAAGDFHVTEAAMEAFRIEGREPLWIRHVDLSLLLDGRAIDLNRAFAQLRGSALGELGPDLNKDLVMGPFFAKYAGCEPYTPAECSRLELDHDMLRRIVRDVESNRPVLVTVGGDVLDFLLTCARVDLILRVPWRLLGGREDRRSGSARLHLSRLCVGGYVRTDCRASDVTGFMLTANAVGAGMLPTRDRLLERIASYGKTISAMHVLVFDRLEAEKAIREVLGWPQVGVALVGASKEKHIARLAEISARLSSDL